MTVIMSAMNHISQHISQLDAINRGIKESLLSNLSCNGGFHYRRIMKYLNPLNPHNIQEVSISYLCLCV